MDYEFVKDQLESKKQDLLKKLESADLTPEDSIAYQLELDNYQYILEMTDMNYFQRGLNN